MAYLIHRPTSGGKAGKGCAKTSNYQVRWSDGGGERIVKQFRFKTDDDTSRLKAKHKAEEYVREAMLNHEDPVF